MRRLDSLVVTTLITLVLAAPSVADIDPANMRSGDVFFSVNAPATQVHVNLFSVPSGMRFVLTDVAVTFGPLESQFLTVSDQAGTERWANWTRTPLVPGTSVAGRIDHHWESGIVYEPGSQVDMLISNNAAMSQFRTDLAWSGYLVPVSTTSATQREPQQLGLDVTPNPARRGVTLRFELARADEVKLAIYDVQGRKVRVIERGLRSEGSHEARWDGLDQRGRPMEAGTYFARFETKHDRVVKQFVAVQ